MKTLNMMKQKKNMCNSNETFSSTLNNLDIDAQKIVKNIYIMKKITEVVYFRVIIYQKCFCFFCNVTLF